MKEEYVGVMYCTTKFDFQGFDLTKNKDVVFAVAQLDGQESACVQEIFWVSFSINFVNS